MPNNKFSFVALLTLLAALTLATGCSPQTASDSEFVTVSTMEEENAE